MKYGSQNVFPIDSIDMKTVEHHNCNMKKNVTITMEEEVARWARIRAAELETSVSRLVGQMLKEKMLVDQAYEKARDRYLAQPPQALKKAHEKYPPRQDLYELGINFPGGMH